MASIGGDAPPLTAAAEQARHAWQFCGGWFPERLPLYAALYPVDDWHQLVDLMQEIRKAL